MLKWARFPSHTWQHEHKGRKKLKRSKPASCLKKKQCFKGISEKVNIVRIQHLYEIKEIQEHTQLAYLWIVFCITSLESDGLQIQFAVQVDCRHNVPVHTNIAQFSFISTWFKRKKANTGPNLFRIRWFLPTGSQFSGTTASGHM